MRTRNEPRVKIRCEASWTLFDFSDSRFGACSQIEVLEPIFGRFAYRITIWTT